MSNITRITALETRVADVDAKIDRLLAAFEGKAKAKPAKKASAKVTKKAAAPKVTASVRHLVKSNRRDFIAAHEWAQPGTSTQALVQAVLDGAPLAQGWGIGEGYVAKFTGEVREVTATPKRKARKSAKRQVAKVEADAPAKERPADGPRNALGQITPRSEWDLRESLADTGKFDRYEIDAIVASQVSA